MTALPRLLIALPLTLLAACSSPSVRPVMPPPPASLAALCGPLPSPPNPMNDPARLEWEAEVVTRYQDCRARHGALADAWRSALEASTAK